MQLSEIRNVIKDQLFENSVHRADSFLNTGINEGYRLVALMSLFDERRASINTDGTRNFVNLPVDGSATCIAPFYIANSHTGARINPLYVEEFEFYSTQWEGNIGEGDAQYYTHLSPYHTGFGVLVLVPIQNIGRNQLTFVGAFEPVAMSADTDVPRIPHEFDDLLVHYGVFYGLVSEQGGTEEALVQYQMFIERLNEFIAMLKARFPGGRDTEPEPVEFEYLNITQQEQRVPTGAQRESQ